MTDLQRYQCDCCYNAYNKAPAANHTIDGEEYELCEECKREFDRVTDYPEKARGNGYQYHGLYFPKSVSGESVWRHLMLVQEDFNSLAEWVLIDQMLVSHHSYFIARVADEYDEDNDGYQEYSSKAEQAVWNDEDYNRE